MQETHTRPKSKPVFDRIRADILGGHYHAGQWLKQAELEANYSATRSDVRASLSSLHEQGLVEYVKNRGFRVYDRSPQELEEINELLAILEVAAAPSMVKNVDARALQDLEDAAEKFDKLVNGGSHVELRLANYEYHRRLNDLCGSKLIATHIRSLRERSIIGPFNRYTTFDGLRASSAEHFEIIALLRARNAEKLAALLKAHVSHF